MAQNNPSDSSEQIVSQHSLVGRLARSAIVWTVPVLIIAALVLIWFYQRTTYQLFDDPLESTVTALIAAVEIVPDTDGEAGIVLNRRPIDPRYQQALSGRYWAIGQLEENGSIKAIVTSRSLYDGSPLSVRTSDISNLLEDVGEVRRGTALGPENGEALRFVARNVIFSELSSEPVLMIAAADNRAAVSAVRQFAVLALILMFVLTMGLVIAVFAQVRSGLKPLFDLRDSVADIREGRSLQVSGAYPKEIQPLASELNRLIDHNKDIVERARTHVSNLAHALKTPLAVLRNEVAEQDDALSEIVKRQTETMKAQVDHHLQRARAAARGQAIGQRTQIAPVIDGLSRTLPRIYASRDVALILANEPIDPLLYFRGEKRDFEEMLGNLLDNAFKWARSQVFLDVNFTESNAGNLILTISDDGDGLTAEQFAQAIKRGIRLDEAVPGTGFGLAIVDDLATAYNGSLKRLGSQLGGLTLQLTLPGRQGE